MSKHPQRRYLGLLCLDKKFMEPKYDYVYRLPEYVQDFLTEANAEMEGEYILKPWTVNMAVTLFFGRESLRVITYDAIEYHYQPLLKQVRQWVIEHKQVLEVRV